MQTQKHADTPILKTSRDLEVYPTFGHVHSIRAFVDAHLSTLNPIEQAIVQASRDALATDDDCRGLLPLVRGGRVRKAGAGVAATAMGARSAYLPEQGLKLKGCRPEDVTFPSWEVDEDRRVRVLDIPFGVLKAESALREILGYCFMRQAGQAETGVPVAVMEYTDVASEGRFCLVTRGERGERVERRIDCGGMTLHRLLRLHGSTFRHRFLGREVDLAGINVARYIGDKVEALIALHFNGGSRGILNSNIGNDVVSGDAFIGLCDFDTFAVRAVPSAGDANGIRAFVFTAFMEVVKSSLPFIDYVETSSYVTLGTYYRERSSIYQTYLARFLESAALRGWNLPAVEREIDEAFGCDLAIELMKELVPNSLTFREFTSDSWYIPHD
jgi:hypothetical protein